MTKMQGLWRPRPKIDQAEFEAAETRVTARLADLFRAEGPESDGDVAPTETEEASDAATETGSPSEMSEDGAVETGSPTEADQELEAEAVVLPLWPGGPRPAIVVEGQSDLVELMAEPALAEPDVVGVTPQPDDPATAAVPGEVVAQSSAAVPSGAVSAAGTSRRRKAPAGATEPRREDAGVKEGPPGGARAGRPATRPTKTRPKGKGKAAPAPAVATASCPYCAVLLQPPPASSQRCAHCRQRIVVKRVAGRAAYLTEAAVLVFEAERRRLGGAGRLTRERERWLKLAAAAGAPPERVTRLAAAQLSEDVVDGARTLYLVAVERSFQVAKRERRWEDASRIRREHALALYRVAGSPVPPPAEIVKLHRDGAAAELRGLAEIARDAELVGATCCDACRTDDGQVFKIAAELRVPRLPHDGCPKGLCQCGWDLAARQRAAFQRYLRPRARAGQRPGQGGHPPTA